MAARPLVVGITDLVRRPGTRRPVQRSVVLEGLAITTAVVPPEAEIELDLLIEALSNGVVVTGSVNVPWVGECRRCLAEVAGASTAQVKEIFERRPTEGETYPLADDFVDLEPMVRDAALLVLPLAPLCADDCLGPAPDLFPAQVPTDLEVNVYHGEAPADDADDADEVDGDGDGGDDDEDDGEAPKDPRWAALDQLKFD